MSEQEAVLRRLRQEAEEQLLRAEREGEELREEVRSVQHDRDQSLLQAETEKQQVSDLTLRLHARGPARGVGLEIGQYKEEQIRI